MDPVLVARRLGLGVWYLPRGSAQACRVSVGRGAVGIWVREDSSATWRAFAVAHALGHAILHSTTPAFTDTTFGGDSRERQANVFAAELLMDAGWLRYYASKYRYCAPALAKAFGVTVGAMRVRLTALDIPHV